MRQILQEVIARRLSDPRIRGLVTVTSIEISRDMRDAKVNVSIFPERYESQTMHGLRDATIHIQKLVNAQLTMRRPPHIAFELDKSLKKQAAVLAAIRQANPHLDEEETTTPGQGDEDDPPDTEREPTSRPDE